MGSGWLIQQDTVRRSRAHLSEFNTTLLHLRNPWIAAFWSFAFPGCGNLAQSRLGKGLLLICWELVVNTNAKVNLAIMYTLLGQFDTAKHVVNTRWFLLYVALYVYAIWDSYRGSVDLNKQFLLADREDAYLTPFLMESLDINFQDKRSPWLAASLSLLSPGLGHLYIHKVITGLFFIGWTLVTMYYSNALPAVHLTLMGDFSQAKSIVQMQWLMYLPSIYGFVLYDTYQSTVEFNKLLEKAQSNYLRTRYQQPDFKIPL